MIATTEYSFIRNPKGQWVLNVPEGVGQPAEAQVIVTDGKAMLLRDEDFLILDELPGTTVVRLAGDVATGLTAVLVVENGEESVVRTYRAALYMS